MRAVLLAALLACASAIGLGAGPAAACSCRCQDDAASVLREVPILFRGRPVGETVEGNLRRYAFDVIAVHKGEVPARVTVRTPRSSAACGVTFRGEETLVGARLVDGVLSVGLCTQHCIGRHKAEIDRLLAR